MKEQRESGSNRALENTALFSTTFMASVLAEYIGDTLHNPSVTDVPAGGVIALSLALSTITTVTYDRLRRQR